MPPEMMVPFREGTVPEQNTIPALVLVAPANEMLLDRFFAAR